MACDKVSARCLIYKALKRTRYAPDEFSELWLIACTLRTR